MRAVGVIPARFVSTRFPGKALAPILGVPMICWVLKGASESKLLDRVIVATDDRRIASAITARGGEAVMTSPEHGSGSDRVWEVAQGLDADYVVNIQGDEPTITGDVIDSCLKPLLENSNIDVATLKIPIADPEELKNPNVVKVVTGSDGFAIYFSRSPVPHTRTGEPEQALHGRHIGVYAYTKEALRRFCGLPPSRLEQSEQLEQLRGLEAGLRYFVVEADCRTFDVNTPGDLAKAEEMIKQKLGGA